MIPDMITIKAEETPVEEVTLHALENVEAVVEDEPITWKTV